MNITAKSTKAELLQALSEAEAELDMLRDAYYTDQPITMGQVRLAMNTIRREFMAAVRDAYRFGAWCRKGFDQMLDKMSLSVNN